MERDACCCFTGHRRIPAQEGLWLRRRLREEIVRLYQEQGVYTFLAGGALGFDTMAAQEVVRVRGERFPQLRLMLVLPYPGQERAWSQRDAAVYRGLLRQADEVVYTSAEYHRGCMAVRNRYLVDHSARCLCYLTRQQGGTAYTARYARQQGIAVLNLALFPEKSERDAVELQ